MYNNLNNMYKFIMNNSTTDAKLELIKLYAMYKKIISQSDYKQKEDSIYEKYSAKNDNDKIKIELHRINSFLKKDDIVNHDKQNELLSITKTFNIYLDYLDKSENNELLVKEIINNIISLELSLDMKIALYKEYCDYFENMINEKYLEIAESDKDTIKSKIKGIDV